MSQMRSTVEDVHSAPLSRGKKVAVAIKGITDFFNARLSFASLFSNRIVSRLLLTRLRLSSTENLTNVY